MLNQFKKLSLYVLLCGIGLSAAKTSAVITSWQVWQTTLPSGSLHTLVMLGDYHSEIPQYAAQQKTSLYDLITSLNNETGGHIIFEGRRQQILYPDIDAFCQEQLRFQKSFTSLYNRNNCPADRKKEFNNSGFLPEHILTLEAKNINTKITFKNIETRDYLQAAIDDPSEKTKNPIMQVTLVTLAQDMAKKLTIYKTLLDITKYPSLSNKYTKITTGIHNLTQFTKALSFYISKEDLSDLSYYLSYSGQDEILELNALLAIEQSIQKQIEKTIVIMGGTHTRELNAILEKSSSWAFVNSIVLPIDVVGITVNADMAQMYSESNGLACFIEKLKNPPQKYIPLHPITPQDWENLSQAIASSFDQAAIKDPKLEALSASSSSSSSSSATNNSTNQLTQLLSASSLTTPASSSSATTATPFTLETVAPKKPKKEEPKDDFAAAMGKALAKKIKNEWNTLCPACAPLLATKRND